MPPEHMKNARQPSPDEPRIATPAWALARAAEISAEMASRIKALGVNIVGDISGLSRVPEDAPGPGRGHRARGAARARRSRRPGAHGPFIAGGADGRSVEEIVRDLDARSLAKALAKRCGQRVPQGLAR